MRRALYPFAFNGLNCLLGELPCSAIEKERTDGLSLRSESIAQAVPVRDIAQLHFFLAIWTFHSTFSSATSICCSIFAFKLYPKTWEQFYRNFGIYKKSQRTVFCPDFCLNHKSIPLSQSPLPVPLASVHLPHPFRFGFRPSVVVTPFALH